MKSVKMKFIILNRNRHMGRFYGIYCKKCKLKNISRWQPHNNLPRSSGTASAFIQRLMRWLETGVVIAQVQERREAQVERENRENQREKRQGVTATAMTFAVYKQTQISKKIK